MDIFGIETSCDETAAAVVRDGREVLCSVVHTQIPLHRQYGGVVPEIASRAHVEKMPSILAEAFAQYRAAAPGGRIDAVAVTYGPGLAPALTVGLNAAKGLAVSLGVPLLAINHIEAHLHTPFLFDAGSPEPGVPSPEEAAPALALAISGGHTHWFAMPRYGQYEVVGQTLDDAAGEAFDKAAKLLGLGYPGGPVVDKLAREYLSSHPGARLVPFPKGRPREGVGALAGLPAELCVSFSGLKTALLRHVQKEGVHDVAMLAASYQEAIVGAVADRTRTALRRGRYRALIAGGGVSLNSRLRAALAEAAGEAGVRLLLAKPRYCGDNAAMIAGLAFYRRNVSGDAAMRADVAPSL